MPELVANGPVISVHLMNELDSGKVVFFCGAGISAGPGSDLPNFAELVQHVYKANHVSPDAVEREALDCEGKNSDRWRPNFDKALGLLERADRLGANALRRTVIKRLSTPPTGKLTVHQALIALSRREQGIRLITTNFDNRFVEAGLEEKLVDAAPKLSVPKPHSWSSLVHLHGRILPNDDGADLILTAADFGRAYLTEQWAARFVTDLFREFTVVFVGYSVSDPVMSYLVDALAAERKKGARFATAYAFADHDGTRSSEQRTRDGWQVKNVEPILYDSRESHRLLADTLIEWARIRCDPFHARSRIAINEITKMPAGPNDPVVERVTWALQDPVAARALADEPPILDGGDFTKIENWLEVFAERDLMCCAPTDADQGGPSEAPAVVRLVDNGFQPKDPRTLDMTRAHLARWMARHLHVPQLLGWVLRNGGHLHPRLRLEVAASLAAEDMKIPPRLRLLWTVLLDTEPIDHWRFVRTSDRYLSATSTSERRRIEDEALQSIVPRLVVRPGPAQRVVFQKYFDEKQKPIPPIDTCGHLEVVFGEEDRWYQVDKILEEPGVLSRHAVTFTGYLEQALTLSAVADEGCPGSIPYSRPSISADDQNWNNDEWAHLIDLVRDSYTALAAIHPRRADNLLRRWVLLDRPLFRRLALHALAENTKSDIHLAKKLLVAGRSPGVWKIELHREVLRFFRLAGSRLPRTLRAEIVRAIHAGPKRGPRRLRYEKALRLRELAASGAKLDKKSKALVVEVFAGTKVDPDERDEPAPRDEETTWTGNEDGMVTFLLRCSVEKVTAAFENEEMDFAAFRFRKLTLAKPIKAVSAMRRLAQQGKWPETIWRSFLQSLAELRATQKRNRKLQAYVARLLATAPAELFVEAGFDTAIFIENLAKENGAEGEQELEELWTKAWNGVGSIRADAGDKHDPIEAAWDHPAGRLAEAALERLWKYEPTTGSGFPEPVRQHLDRINADPYGHLGRTMLATRLHNLFAIDPDWVREHLIPRLSLGRCSEEAKDLWSAYGWSPRVGPGLLAAFKDSFLEILYHQDKDERSTRSLTSLFISICLELPGRLSAQEIHRVVQSMSEEALKTVLSRLKRCFGVDSTEGARIWRDKVHPWLENYWPREQARNTAGTSGVMLDMLPDCGEDFPVAAEWSLDYLRPLEDFGLHRLSENGHASQHPESMLQVLDRIVDAEVLPVHQRPLLNKILKEVAAVRPTINGDDRFQKLYQLANR